jgi:hypothetical protein
MPAYTKLRTFVNALKTGTTHITERLDEFFGDLNRIQTHLRFSEFVNGDWSAGAPAWLGPFLKDEVGLTGPERDHVMQWPAAELEKARAAAAAAVQAGQSPTFRWVLYDGAAPNTVSRTDAAGKPQVLFQSPGASLRLTSLNYGEIYVEEV